MTDGVPFDIPLIYCTFVTTFLSSMGSTKSTGLDCIEARLLKIGSKVLSLSITFLINKMIIPGVFRQFEIMLK